VTPLANRERRTAAGIPVGFDEDAEYFGALRRRLLATLLAVPKEVALCAERDAFRYVTLLFLLAAHDVSVISVWSPTFLTTLLAPLPDWLECLARDLEDGAVTPPAPLDEGLRARLAARLGRHRGRARDVVRTLRLVTGTCSERVLPPGRGAQGLAARAAREGGREGALKPAVLDRRSGWAPWFADG